jgi:hypothetical protein
MESKNDHFSVFFIVGIPDFVGVTKVPVVYAVVGISVISG